MIGMINGGVRVNYNRLPWFVERSRNSCCARRRGRGNVKSLAVKNQHMWAKFKERRNGQQLSVALRLAGLIHTRFFTTPAGHFAFYAESGSYE